jgi:soluble P-type ATPase
MAVEGVIFDVSDTLITSSGQAVNGVIDAIGRLRGMGVQVIAAHNDGPQGRVAQLLARAGITVDQIVTRHEVGKAKGSPLWIDVIKRDTGLRTNQLIYVGDSDYDMITASHSKVVYMHAEWAKPRGPYGIPAPAPGWVPAVVAHIFRKQHRWYWTLDQRDTQGRRVRKMALIDGNGAGDDRLKAELIATLKSEGDPRVGQMLLRDFVVLHLAASMYEEGVQEAAGIWTTYPGRHGRRTNSLAQALDVTAKLFRDKYRGDLFLRHAPARHSRDAFTSGGIPGAIDNQLTSVHLNPTSARALAGQSVLVIDDFLTRGITTEVGRNLLLAGGASEVITVAVGKYGPTIHLLTKRTGQLWDPFAPGPLTSADFRYDEVRGMTNPAALTEFVASHQAMKAERW